MAQLVYAHRQNNHSKVGKAYLNVVLHMNEAQVVHVFTQSLKEHMSLLHQNNTENI